jgi:pseudoazurin
MFPPGTPAISAESRLRLRLAIKRKFALAQQRRALFPLNDPESSLSGRMTIGERKMRKAMMAAVIALATTIGGAAAAAEVEVKMLNKGAEGMMVFEPALVKIAPGDSVKFVATDKGHNAETIKGMLPVEAAPFAGKSGEDVAVTFEKPGVYGVKCLPHYGMGMVAMVVVGTPGNVDEAKAIPQIGKAKQVMAGLFDKLAAQTAQK